MSAQHTAEELVEALNRECYCITLDAMALQHALDRDLHTHGLYQSILDSRPHLFAPYPVFVSRQHAAGMAQIVSAIESVVALPGYREAVLQWAPAIAQVDPGSPGAFLGYDFHLSEQGPKLIEINTNAGGALLNICLGRAQRACCDAMREMVVGPLELDELERHIFEMFAQEWRLQRPSRDLRTVAIVDDAPEQQYLYPEFLLFQELFQRHGAQALIADARQLRLGDGRLWAGDVAVDLIYNRLTDFALQMPEHAALREAYQQGMVVVTPHPRAHALYADKRNLAVLGDAERLRAWGVPEPTVEILRAGIPHTVAVTPEQEQALWANRRHLFFKPASGYGSKAAYRGDKLTRRVWSEILAGGYVAQELVPPSERRLRIAGEEVSLKLDLRNYVYNGQVQLLAARLYQGQTTNFRTPGGGFATVFSPLGACRT